MSAPAWDQLPWRARQHLASAQPEPIYNPYSTATWRLMAPGGVRYVKAAFVGAYPSLAAECDRAVWPRERGVSVPEVVDHGIGDGVEWLPVRLPDPGRARSCRASGRCWTGLGRRVT